MPPYTGVALKAYYNNKNPTKKTNNYLSPLWEYNSKPYVLKV